MNYAGVQAHIDRGRGIAALHVGQPYDVYRIAANGAVNYLEVVVAQTAALSAEQTAQEIGRGERREGHDLAFEATRDVLQQHGGLWFYDESFVISHRRD